MIIIMMVLETSLYAAQFIADNVGSLKPHSKWKETDSDEMHVLGLLIHMGLLYKPRLSMYWSWTANSLCRKRHRYRDGWRAADDLHPS